MAEQVVARVELVALEVRTAELVVQVIQTAGLVDLAWPVRDYLVWRGC